MTREHVIPQWVSRTFSELGPGSFDVEMINEEGRRPPLRWSSPKAVELKVKVVCASCNHGWLADLEGEAIPILDRMIRGLPTEIDDASSKLLAAWTFKTTLLAEYAYPDAPFFSLDEAEAFYRKHKVPSLVVQVGAYRGAAFTLRHKIGRLALDGDRGGRYRGCVSTFVIGHSLLHLFSARFPPVTKTAEVHYPPEFTARLTPIWPFGGRVHWPSQEAFDDLMYAELERWPPASE